MSLAVDYKKLKSEVARFMGGDRVEANWGTYGPDVTACINRGLRMFYWPPKTSSTPIGYQWSFLHPEKKLSLVAGTSEYAMDADLSALDSHVVPDSPNDRFVIRIVPVAELRRLETTTSSKDKPLVCALIPQTTDGTSNQSFKLRFFPVPSSNMDVRFTYSVVPQSLVNDTDVPYGANVHSETILMSCFAAAEDMRESMEGKVYGNRFLQLLEGSIRLDMRQSSLYHYGYNGNNSAQINGLKRIRNIGSLTVNGNVII